MPLTDPDYRTFERFVDAVLQRVRRGEASVSDGRADIMHPFTALDQGNDQEFLPWMLDRLDEWEADGRSGG